MMHYQVLIDVLLRILCYQYSRLENISSLSLSLSLSLLGAFDISMSHNDKSALFENIYIDIDMTILEDIENIDKYIFENIDIVIGHS